MAPIAAIDVPSFVEKQIALLTEELEAEAALSSTILSSTTPSALARSGLAVLNLVPTSQRTGFGGKCLLELEPDTAVNNSGSLTGGAGGEGHGIRTGDIVRISEMVSGSARKKVKTDAEESGVEGVVVRVQENRLTVALGKGKKGGSGPGDSGDSVVALMGKRVWM